MKKPAPKCGKTVRSGPRKDLPCDKDCQQKPDGSYAKACHKHGAGTKANPGGAPMKHGIYSELENLADVIGRTADMQAALILRYGEIIDRVRELSESERPENGGRASRAAHACEGCGLVPCSTCTEVNLLKEEARLINAGVYQFESKAKTRKHEQEADQMRLVSMVLIKLVEPLLAEVCTPQQQYAFGQLLMSSSSLARLLHA